MPPKQRTSATTTSSTTAGPPRRSPPTLTMMGADLTLGSLADPTDDLEDDSEMLATLHALNAKRAKARTQKATQGLAKIRASVDATRAAGVEQVDKCAEEAKVEVERVAREGSERRREVQAKVAREVGETERMVAMLKENMATLAESRRESQFKYDKMWDSMIQTLVGPELMQHLHAQTVDSLTARSTAAAQDLRMAAMHAAEATAGKVHQAYEVAQRMDPAAVSAAGGAEAGRMQIGGGGQQHRGMQR